MIQNKENHPTVFETSQENREMIDEAMKNLIMVCQICHVPVFAAAAVANSESETEYVNAIYSATAHQIHLSDDRIRKYELIADGFEVVPPREARKL